MKALIALATLATLAACTPTPTKGGEEPPAPDCQPGAEFCAE